MTERKQYWGLFNFMSQSWRMENDKRLRWVSPIAVNQYIRGNMCGSEFYPRPFYVVRKPTAQTALKTALALGVIEAVRRWEAGGIGWTDVKNALKRYDEGK